MRKGIQFAAAAAVAAVLLAGCSSGGDENGSGAKGSATPSPTASSAGETPGGDVSLASLEGGWTTHARAADQGLLILSVSKREAVLIGKKSCGGKVTGDKPLKLAFKCADGDTEHAEGTVRSLTGKKLTIAWGSGKEDVFTRTEGTTDLPSIDPSSLDGFGQEG
ncbi:hypothetical protein C3486_07375 [Streptomyces sp. Ru73]|uniref:hypothetical protein n=1 Tax=Streptomyces sp. Ru73 TaxID=2080748 RepID=UPI000CDD4C31|nr:hypothetical protein [Streptomyces sp. Ru73]POX41762.1 hypothetical protein C3486_07375 [Streptomyces sp. Ru73]